MTLSKDFGFGEYEVMLRDAARKFFTDNSQPDQIHRLVADNPDLHRPIENKWVPEQWQEICELGWHSVCIPEECGGAGMPLVAAVAIAEEAGKAAFPSPLLTTYNSVAVLKACNTEAAKLTLEKITCGSAATLAMTNQKGSWETTDTDVSVINGKLSGTAYFVQDAQKADLLIVSAASSDGISLYAVDSNAEGINIIADGIIDLTRDQAHIVFDQVTATEIAGPGQGDKALTKAMPAILCITSADMVGAGEWLLQTTTEYATTRVQFERPIGFFQAVKHPLVNVMLEIDQAKSLTYAAACAYEEAPEQAEELSRMAKSRASDMAVFSANRAVQFHGGIGFTWECFVHLYFKRQMHNQVLYGDGKYQREKLAEHLIGADGNN
ncbi:acyl-CoA dehydrogenase family protein [Maricurvus nonylphenolicus]|uniref:acyl-CoA dehydrogenase family protein n=1 Tax=Maricurvus nonylphenolicus TaxID=1008307 RepID=UPI0036F1E91A